MASRYSSVSRSLMAAARSSAARPANVPRHGLRPRLPSSATQSRRFTFSSIRTPVELGCVPSLFPLHSAVAASRLTAHVSVSVRACCELSQGQEYITWQGTLSNSPCPECGQLGT